LQTFFTAIQAIHLVGGLQPGQNVLIHAGASGVGQSAIQLAKVHGANKIFATAGSDEKCKLCKDLGADFAINYRSSEDFAKVVARETNGRGVDLIVDMVGAAYWAQNIESAGLDARIVIIASLSGSKIPDFDLSQLQRRRIGLLTTTLRSRDPDYQLTVRNFFHDNVLPHLVTGKIKTTIDKVYSWKDIVDAHKRMEASTNAGKIICQVD
jgi:NADPH:quinone reductase-like Zn-dependent oxidoreductase